MTAEDCAEVDRFAQVKDVMRPAEVTVSADTDPREAFDKLDAVHAAVAVGVDDDGRLVGVLTRTGALRATLYDPAVDAGGRAAGRRRGRASTARSADKAGRLLDAGVDCLVVDTAHGHQDRMVEALGADPRAVARRCRSWPATWSPPRAPAT